MRKKLLSIALVLGLVSVSFITKAQDGRFSVGAEIGIPMGTFGDGVGVGIGGTLRFEAPVGDNIGITGTAGYISFSGKDYDVLGVTFKGESTYLIPIQAGFKYYFMENQNGFYGHIMLGVHMYKVVEYEIDPTTFAVTTKNSMKAALSYAPELGYHLANLDFGLRYQMFSTSTDVVNPITGATTSETNTSGYLGLRIAYVFGGN